MSIAANIATNKLPPSLNIVPPTAALSPSTAPIETSISPVRITKAIPTESNTNTTESFNILSKEVGCKNDGFFIPTPSINTIRNNKLPVSLILINLFSILNSFAFCIYYIKGSIH